MRLGRRPQARTSERWRAQRRDPCIEWWRKSSLSWWALDHSFSEARCAGRCQGAARRRLRFRRAGSHRAPSYSLHLLHHLLDVGKKFFRILEETEELVRRELDSKNGVEMQTRSVLLGLVEV